uniref:Uncharacterized protein n=1 Tax=Solanum lycopersicum TaxID=4081 RepID=A0A3Q7G139_SOLLC
MNQYTLTSDAKGQGQRIRINAEKRTIIGENRLTTPISSRNKQVKKSIQAPPDFYPMEDNDTRFPKTEVSRDTQRSDHLQKSPFESRKAKTVVGVTRGSKEHQTSPAGYDKEQKMTEVYCDAERSDTSILNSKKEKKVIEVAEDSTRNETSPIGYDKAEKMTEVYRDDQGSPCEYDRTTKAEIQELVQPEPFLTKIEFNSRACWWLSPNAKTLLDHLFSNMEDTLYICF